MRGSPWAGTAPVVSGAKARHTLTVGKRCLRTLDVRVPEEVMTAAMGGVLLEMAARVKLPGFRKGRVPPQVVWKRFAKEIEREAAQRAIQDSLDDALAEEGLRMFSNVTVVRARVEEDGCLSYTAQFEVQPQVELGRLGGFRVERPPAVVQEGAADHMMELLRLESGRWEPAEEGRPRSGDSVTVRMTPLDGPADEGSREYDLVLGDGHALPGIEEAILTLSAGEEGSFNVAFPDDLADGEDQGAPPAAENRRLKIALLERRTRVHPPLDDDFARSVGGFEDLAALRASIERGLEREARRQADEEYRDNLLDQVVEAHSFEVPGSMVSGYMRALLGRDDEEGGRQEPEAVRIPWEDDETPAGADQPSSGDEELLEEVRPIAERAVRREVMIARIAHEHDLHATEADVEARVREMAAKANESPSRIRARLRKDSRLANLEQAITRHKVLDFLAQRSPAT